jgi:hypothetical protein
MAELKVQQHPDKTFIGRVSRGFDFLGYRFSSAGLVGVALQTVVRCVERMNRLYEQGADQVRIGDYVRRWCVWVRSGLDERKEPSAVDGSVCFSVSWTATPHDADVQTGSRRVPVGRRLASPMMWALA